MKGRRHTPEQVIRKLREADRLLAEGADVPAVCRHLEVSVPTYQRWRAQYKAMRPEDVVRALDLHRRTLPACPLMRSRSGSVDSANAPAPGP